MRVDEEVQAQSLNLSTGVRDYELLRLGCYSSVHGARRAHKIIGRRHPEGIN